MNLFSISNAVWSLAFLAIASVAIAHEGEDHGTPEPVVAPSGSALLSASGKGTAFEGVLKYLPFAPGNQVALTFYLLSAETNRPVGDATVTASLSDGDRSISVTFSATPGGPAGVYTASVTPSSAAEMSWLFDVTTPDDSDLIAIGGFVAGWFTPTVATDVLSPHDHDGGSPPRLAVFASLAALLAIGAFAAGRMTAQKGASA